MGRLDAKQRSKLKSSQFGDPENRAYPINNKSHARNAKARASEMEHKGVISKRKEEQIDRRADRKLAKKKPAAKKKSSSKKKASKRGR